MLHLPNLLLNLAVPSGSSTFKGISRKKGFCRSPIGILGYLGFRVYTQGLLCSSFLSSSGSRVREYNVLPQKGTLFRASIFVCHWIFHYGGNIPIKTILPYIASF